MPLATECMVCRKPFPGSKHQGFSHTVYASDDTRWSRVLLACIYAGKHAEAGMDKDFRFLRCPECEQAHKYAPCPICGCREELC